MQSRLLSASDLATYLAVSQATVRRMAKRGELPKPIRLGGTVRWDRNTVDAYLDRLAKPTAYVNPDHAWGGSHGAAT